MDQTFASTQLNTSAPSTWAGSPVGSSPVRRNPLAGIRLLIEIALAVSKIIVIITGMVVAGLSIFNGTSIEISLLRAALSVIVVGLALWIFNWRLSTALMESAAADRKAMDGEAALSTIERAA